ncbi:ABC transporter permease [Halalkalibacter hemicellulosilyticus]|uniref:ABC transporter n=1 Tax=Halalkalibacter hemicellulosilyticusJCM 9152 TaxID=1236971 RepID=W4QKY0_9BACI|nr:ABC transporter permease [Halalkalibacter hemicellulosilyticus]GAE32557.1 ABC transporter [Halalkalibacter hemicellulosilyticusJCM 9152]
MNKFWIVLSHTYLSRVKTKSFIITTALFLLFIFAMVNLQSIIELFSSDEQEQTVAVIDESEYLYDVLSESMEQVDPSIQLIEYDGTLEEAEEAVLNGQHDGVLQIFIDQDELPTASYHTNQFTDTMIQTHLEAQLQQMKVALATSQAGIDEDVLASIYAPVSFETVAIDSGDGSSTRTEEQISGAIGLVYIILFLLYFAVITYGNMIAMDIANEKTSRVMEILISSSSPVSQMFAKILGIALLGLTQFGVIILFGYFLIQQKQDEAAGSMFEYFGLTDVDPATYIYAIVFFLLGYLLYATMSAMLGSIVSRIEDVQQLMMPVIILIVIAFMIAMFSLTMPDSTLVTVTSFIPFFTPMLMFLRVGMLEVPLWEVGLSIGLMLVTIAILAMIGARVYRGGVLMYGTSTSLKDFKRALQLSKKE